MTTMMSTAMKLSAFAVSCSLIVACSGVAAAESRMINDASYKNHRTSRNDTLQNKYPVYAAQVYADLSNIKDYTTVETAEQPKLTETPLDVVRIYITPPATTGKRKLDAQHQTVVPTTQSPVNSFSTSRTSPHPMFFVTAVNGAGGTYSTSTDNHDLHARASATYSVSSTSNVVKETTDLRTPTASEWNRKLGGLDGGAKTKQVSKIQNQPPYLLYATTQSPQPSPSPTTKVQQLNSGNASKPFATVLVPKQMLDSGDSVSYNVREDSFRPIAAPLFSYKPNMVDSNSVLENRRISTSNVQVASALQSASIPKSSVKPGFAKSDAYKVQEEHGLFEDRLSNDSYSVANNRQLRVKPNQSVYADRLQTVENPKRDHVKPQQRDTALQQQKKDAALQQQQKDAALQQQHRGIVPEKNVQPLYGLYSAPDPSKYDKAQQYKITPPKSAVDQHREFYPATEVSPARNALPYSPYNSAGKYDVRSAPLPLEREKFAGGSPPNKVLSGPWSTPADAGPEFAMDDVNAKDVLKSILRDMLKSKQQAEVKKPLKSTGPDEIIDSYFKINPVDSSFDSSSIETDLSCNLQSTKYITDGQCMTTKPVVEAVCADRCLVYDSSGPSRSYSQRQRSSMTIKQDVNVEALHCVDGDVKFERIQLKCRDGNMINNVVKVVTNCRCKLHQIQPQMRNTRTTGSSTTQQSGMMNPGMMNSDIMKIATGTF